MAVNRSLHGLLPERKSSKVMAWVIWCLIRILYPPKAKTNLKQMKAIHFQGVLRTVRFSYKCCLNLLDSHLRNNQNEYGNQTYAVSLCHNFDFHPCWKFLWWKFTVRVISTFCDDLLTMTLTFVWASRLYSRSWCWPHLLAAHLKWLLRCWF
jgi:hypothetical protein